MKILFLLSFTMYLQLKSVERQVLLFYTNSGKEAWQKQKAELAGREQEMKERDILVKSFHIGSSDAALLREWKVDPSKKVTFILIGRDGGEKFRSDKFVRADQLFAMIDAMPMRKNEMRKSKGKQD